MHLKNKRFLVLKYKEFIPRSPIKGAKHIPKEMYEVTDDRIAATFYPKKRPELVWEVAR